MNTAIPDRSASPRRTASRLRGTPGVHAALVALVLTLIATTPAWSQEPARDQAVLFRETLVQDISTAGFYELVSWLETLGLSTRGDRSALVDRLYTFYELSPDDVVRYSGRGAPAADDAQPPDDEPPLVVDAASRTRYFTLEEIDERYIRLSGGVVLTLRDRRQEAVHRIEADEITFNEERNTLAASGSVVYVLERDGSVEQFTGEALTVELGEWSGAFVQGVTERERTIEGEQIDFSFAGSYITRSSDDVIVLEDGRITSSDAVPPNYEIRASKIWVLAPGEWGLQNAFLYVGRVPVLYLPFFFKPGNEFFFNPSVGHRDRAGAYIQTTTYFLGTPEEETSPFSLLQIAEDQGPQSERRIEGLFLVPRDGGGGATAEEASPDASVRLLADVYTNLGAYLALEAQLPELGPLRQVQFYAGLAASRHIYITSYPTGDGGGERQAFTPYYLADGQATQSWNTTQIGNYTLPFRFGIDASTRLTSDRLSANARLDYYSDPRFRLDFGDRSEQIDWLGLLGQGASTAAPSSVTSLLWQVDASWRADVSTIPLVTQLSLQRALIALNWRTREIPEELQPPEVRAADQSPQTSFFYPESLRLPEISATIAGTLFEYPSRSVAGNDSEPDARDELIPPWAQDGNDATDADEEHHGPLEVTVPPTLPALSSPQLPLPLRAKLSYSLAPTAIANSVFDSDAWNEPVDMDFTTAYSGASLRLAGSLAYGGGVSADALRLDGTLATSTQYRAVYGRDPSLTDDRWLSLRRQAWSFTGFNATNNLTVRALPLRDIELLAGSSVSYTTQLLLYRIAFDSVVDDAPIWNYDQVSWDEEFVRQHQIQATTELELGERQSLALTAALPPRPEEYSANLTARISPLLLTMSSGLRKPETDWVFNPLAATATLTPWESVRLVDALSYDIEEQELTFNRTTLTAGPVSAEFELRSTPAYTFGGPGVGWQTEGDAALRPANARFGLALASDFDPFWKNRIIADVGANFSWNSSLTRFTESSLRFVFSGTLEVHRFLRVSMQTTSINSQSYVYVPVLANTVGRDPRNLLVDLLKSFNFFNEADRIESGFNLQSITVAATHDLGDWDLTVGYTGKPELVTADDQTRAYEWRGTLDITLQWRPIKELTTTITVDPEEISFEGDS